MKHLCTILTGLFFISCQSPIQFEIPETAGMSWHKGNTHTHTTNSDGDSSPQDVATWYKNHGYQFLFLTDHNFLTNPATLSSLTDSSFQLIPGEEVTTRFEKKEVHINGLNIKELVKPENDTTLVGTIQKNVDAIRAAEGAPHINHPNFRWSLTKDDLLQVRRDRLIEIFNGHPTVHNQGGGGFPGMEQVWDHLLTSGKRIYGIAVDDAHHFKGEFGPTRSNPGKGWVVVKAAKLEGAEIVNNLEKGYFYASSGVSLDDVIVQEKTLEVRITQRGSFKYTTTFIGANGAVLKTSIENPAIYTLQGNEKYVRAKVIDSGGSAAWIQPVFTQR